VAESAAPIDEVLAALAATLPGVVIERLQVTHPSDDDNLWYTRAGGSCEVQIESHPGGEPPFLIEGDTDRHEVHQASEAVDLIVRLLAR
jgi:hypothetical protein